MPVWGVVLKDGGRKTFIGGCCAVSFYNADRDYREAPQEAELKDGEVAYDCDLQGHWKP